MNQTILPKTGFAATAISRGAFWACWEDSDVTEGEGPLACGFASTQEHALRVARRLAETAPEGAREVSPQHAQRVREVASRDRRWLPHLPLAADPEQYCSTLPYWAVIKLAVLSYCPAWGELNDYAVAEKAIAAFLAGDHEVNELKFRKG